jgi:hypothetical protein
MYLHGVASGRERSEVSMHGAMEMWKALGCVLRESDDDAGWSVRWLAIYELATMSSKRCVC